MKKAIFSAVLVVGLMIVLAGTASAQTFDVFGGYSFDRLSQNNGNGSGSTTSNLNGGEGTVGFYPASIFGVVGDFADYHFSTLNGSNGASAPISGNVATYLFGPRIRFPFGPIKPFAQVLFGGAHLGNLTSNSGAVCGLAPTPCTFNPSDNSFALSADGGVDFKVARHFALRGQAGYLMTRFDTGDNGQNVTQNNVRIAVGIVIE